MRGSASLVADKNLQKVAWQPAGELPSAQSLLRQVEALQVQAAELAAVISAAGSHPGATVAGSKGTEALTLGIIRARKQRAKFLPPSLFAEPAWDLLLVLYSATLAQQRMSVSQACAAADLPATTTLRWLNTLEASQLIIRHADPLDARRSFVELTEAGEQAMRNFIQSIQDAALGV
jgi:DNA-binding MarR family transcriptional regulator